MSLLHSHGLKSVKEVVGQFCLRYSYATGSCLGKVARVVEVLEVQNSSFSIETGTGRPPRYCDVEELWQFYPRDYFHVVYATRLLWFDLCLLSNIANFPPPPTHRQPAVGPNSTSSLEKMFVPPPISVDVPGRSKTKGFGTAALGICFPKVSNAMDHTVHPLRGLKMLLWVLRPEGKLMLRHFRRGELGG